MSNEVSKKSKGKIFSIAIAVILACFFFFAFGMIVGKIGSGKLTLNINPNLYAETELPAAFNNTLFKQVWTIIKDDYVDKDKLTDKDLFYGALTGFVSGVGDPYTVFLDPETTKDFEDQISGQFQGIGAEIGLKDGAVLVVAPLPDTPAARAGILAGDRIFAVDGKDVFGLSLDTVVRMIRGEKGTTVKLLISHEGDEAKELSIVRDVIEIKSVKWTFRDDGIAYVEISAFNEDTTPLFNKFVKEAKGKELKGIIVDLRNNPGGLLDSALELSAYWLENKLILIEKFGDGTETKYDSDNNAPLKKNKTVILVNQGSASGSEILAGALQDNQAATIVGKQTFGKGSVQALKKLPDGSSVKVTIAKWLTPNGRSISDEGVAPDVVVEITKKDIEDKKDPQLDKAVELLK